ncbi:hypothetical protein [Microbulbifer sp. TYP-18]|uniref:hypothetical protein n=1 Tax=Microbulbifer sp. TYP-18 TaxID=3230024 RepID=UPI0034C5C4B4
MEIDDETRCDHWYLEAHDRCFYFGHYTPKKYIKGDVWSHSPTNKLIYNLKKPPGARWQKYKTQAEQKVARLLADHNSFQDYIFVPVPPSKQKGHPEYDDRMIRILHYLRKLRPEVQFLELVRQTQSLSPFHVAGARLPPKDLVNYYQIDDRGQPPLPPGAKLIIFDDVLTTGSHFKATQTKLKAHYPKSEIVGLFVARCERP